MINIFNKFRQQLLSENKFSKYILYALGEILLLVVGILLALSINNRNLDRIERKIEREYIISIISDAKKDLSNFTEAIKSNEQRFNNLDSLQKLCYIFDAKKEQEPALMFQYFICLNRPILVTQTDRTLSQLKNSGGMRLIQNKKSINGIIEYEKSFEELYKQEIWFEGGLKDLIEAGVSIFNYKYLPKEQGKFDKKTFFKTARLINTSKLKILKLGNRAFNSYAFTQSYIKVLKDGRIKCIELIKMLESNYFSTIKRKK